jgi:oxaloacetate decarboxylase gamma subunit
MEENLFNQGVTLMLAGMGTVFVFLGLLVAAMTAMAAVVARNGGAPAAAGPSEAEIAAIGAAIRKHRQRSRD